ncbi:hypothetical protein BV898_07963 [Hypsibius exemplaris]|uniref:Solute-binding protein family 3/N-terminal domain-containing protein n=1 Tax=Hypsibius exemplaris TaxID=2072580 RepID=A0A1W0WS47_HYPEX|nr:hypothetical protein BV898_07963 [Hypsibius exemplaris]
MPGKCRSGFGPSSGVPLPEPFRDDLRDQHPDKLGGSDDVLGIRYCALAVQKGSPLRDILNRALQQFVEDGTLDALASQYPYQAC